MNREAMNEWRGICFHKWIPGFQPFDIENHRMLCSGVDSGRWAGWGGGEGGGFDLADGRIGSRESILRPLSHQTGLCPITQHPPLSGPSQYILYQIYCPALIFGKLKNYIFPQPSGW
jgi:hypothetical protein